MNQIKNQKSKFKNDVGIEQMSIVVIGHVDHGKSTVVGRLLADTGSLPEGKLEDVKVQCRRNAKPFEYAFLLDALKDEQAQGITIDSARCFFKSDKRHYIIIDAPGHIEFLKNMISGAARAEAALLVIDAKEGVRENSRRHGYLLSMLGIKQVVVLVNKMDLVDYSQERFDSIVTEYTEFLSQIGVHAAGFIPVSGREGDNVVGPSSRTPWYQGHAVLEALDAFVKELSPIDKPMRLPVQGVYKFTETGDDRRIIAGRLETGTVKIGDPVIFWPSGKRSTIASIEGFNVAPQQSVAAGKSTGVTLTEQVYVTPGELMVRAGEQRPQTGTHLQVNLFWMGRQPMIKGKRYQLKLATAKIPVWLRDVNTVLDASELSTVSNRQQIERHDVAECVLETVKPIAFDLSHDIAQTGRFVIIDNYEIAGGGVVLDQVRHADSRLTEHVQQREKNWQRSSITPAMRSTRYNQRSALVLITGPVETGKIALAKALEERLFNNGRLVYYLGVSNDLAAEASEAAIERDESLHRLGEIAHMFTDGGLILIATVSELDDFELKTVQTLNHPNETLVVNVGSNAFQRPVDLQLDDLNDIESGLTRLQQLLADKQYLIEYYL